MAELSGIRSILNNACQIAGARLFNPLSRAVYIVALASYLGPQVYGILVYGLSWYAAFIPLTATSLGTLLIRDVARQREKASQVVCTTLALRTVATSLTTILWLVLIWTTEGDPNVRLLLSILGLALVGRALFVFAEHIFIAYERSRFVLNLEVVFRPLEVVFGILALIMGGGIIVIACIHAVIWCLQAVTGFWIVSRHLVRLGLDWHLRRAWSLLVHLPSVGLAEISWIWLISGPVVLFRHSTQTEGELGQFALVFQAFVILSAVPWSIGAAAFPVLSRSVDRQDQKDMEFAEIITRATVLVGSCVGLIGLAAGAWVIGQIFGPQYELTGHYLGPGLWLAIPYGIGCTLHFVLAAHGRFKSAAICVAIGALVLSLALPPLASRYGLYGALLAMGLGLSIWATGVTTVVARIGHFGASRALIRPLLAVLLAVGAYYAVTPLASWASLLAGLLTLILAAKFLSAWSYEEISSLSGRIQKIWPFRQR